MTKGSQTGCYSAFRSATHLHARRGEAALWHEANRVSSSAHMTVSAKSGAKLLSSVPVPSALRQSHSHLTGAIMWGGLCGHGSGKPLPQSLSVQGKYSSVPRRGSGTRCAPSLVTCSGFRPFRRLCHITMNGSE